MSTGWSELGPDFLSVGDWAVGQGPDAPDRQLFRKLLAATDGDVVEVGCGPCIDLEALLDEGLLKGRRYTGIDMTPELVKKAQADYPVYNFYVADVCNWQATSPYNVVYARHVLEHVRDGERALAALLEAAEGILIVSFFIRPTFVPSEVGCVIGDGFEHHTYDALRWMELIEAAGFHLYRWDFDHDKTKCAVWMMSREPQPELAQVAHDFFGSAAFRSSVLPVPTRVNEPHESALDDMTDAHTALKKLIPIIERVPELEQLADESHRVAAQVEAHLFPTQDEPDVTAVIRPVRDLKARCEALQHWAVDERVAESQALRDAARVLETRLLEAGRL